jgi:hypothetical protein
MSLMLVNLWNGLRQARNEMHKHIPNLSIFPECLVPIFIEGPISNNSFDLLSRLT